MHNSQELAKKIKSVAKAKKISIGVMLKECELSINTLSSMQAGGYYPRLEAIAKIADYLDCSVDYLLGRTDNRSILNKYDSLNSIGQQRIESYIDGLLENPDYVKKIKNLSTANADGLVIDGILNDTNLNMVANAGISEPPKVKKQRKHT